MTAPDARSLPLRNDGRWGAGDEEHCQLCEKPVAVVWTAPDEMWATVTDRPDGGGILCVACFDGWAEAKGISLRWVPQPLDAALAVPAPPVAAALDVPPEALYGLLAPDLERAAWLEGREAGLYELRDAILPGLHEQEAKFVSKKVSWLVLGPERDERNRELLRKRKREQAADAERQEPQP